MAAAWGTEARTPLRSHGGVILVQPGCSGDSAGPCLPHTQRWVLQARAGSGIRLPGRQAAGSTLEDLGKEISGKMVAVIKQKNEGERRKRDKRGRKRRGKEQEEKCVEGSSLQQRFPLVIPIPSSNPSLALKGALRVHRAMDAKGKGEQLPMPQAFLA